MKSSATPDSARDVPSWVGQQYYRHGLFCASNPKLVLLLTFLGVLYTCRPLFSLPIYSGEVLFYSSKGKDMGEEEKPVWLVGNRPVAYIQQVRMEYMKSLISFNFMLGVYLVSTIKVNIE